jgi:hypothetical protein
MDEEEKPGCLALDNIDAVRHARIACPEAVDVQGILINASALIEEVWPLFASPDGFLYIVV